MGTVADYITKNNEVVLNLVKINLLPLSVMQNYEIYQMVISIGNETKKMKIYEKVAIKNKCSINTVRKAIREMQRLC